MKRLILLMLAVCLGANAAPPHPNLSGVWRWNLAKSDFAKQAPPDFVTYEFKHIEPDLTIATTHVQGGKNATGEAKYVIGSEGENTVMGNPLKYRAKWDDEVLVIETWGTFGKNEMRLIDRYSLSKDQAALTLKRHYEGQGGPQDQTIVMDRVQK